MLSVRFGHVFVLTFLYYTNAERRLIAGENVKTNKRYMVYLLQGKSSIRNYDSWICGGAIIDRWLILTSAACVEDVQNMYAIAATDKYVRADELETDPCTQNWNRKVIYTCVPVEYDLKYDNVSKWSHDDIAIVKVERPYIFDNMGWGDCPYRPGKIAVNFDPMHEAPGTDAIVLGWGHSRKWRLTNMTEDLNQRKLQYVSVSILDTEECKKYFTAPDMAKEIDDYMICTFNNGQLDDSGRTIGSRKYYSDGAMRDRNDGKDQVYKKGKVRIVINGTEIPTNEKDFQKIVHFLPKKGDNENIKKGICQNDHGGPMVKWINGTEHVIGIASVFRVDQQSNCVGPFLYTSTTKNKPFIECILKKMTRYSGLSLRTNTVCDRKATGQQLTILRRYVKWTDDHSDSLAPNLNVHMRPQIPISHYRNRNARK